MLARLFRLVWGGDVDRALRPVLAVSFAGSVAGSAVFVFLGIWAIKHLHAGQSRLAFAYLVGAILSGRHRATSAATGRTRSAAGR